MQKRNAKRGHRMTEEQWKAIVNNDAAYDGVFYCGCRTTGIVCRPSCTTKQGRPRNIQIFADMDEAVRAGYRPCFRCRPDRPGWRGAGEELAGMTKKLIEDTYLDKFSLSELADAMHVNASYLARIFKKEAGMTPLQYHNRVRCERSKAYLEEPGGSIAMAGYSVGYVSASHYAKVFKGVYGVSPSEYREVYFDRLEETLGKRDEQ